MGSDGIGAGRRGEAVVSCLLSSVPFHSFHLYALSPFAPPASPSLAPYLLTTVLRRKNAEKVMKRVHRKEAAEGHWASEGMPGGKGKGK